MMETIWFCLVAIMVVAYVVLDGFDLGAGIVHLLLARNDDERRLIIRTIGPVWDGNEVWLLAGGGTLYFAFPLLYASSFSGFYLPLNIVLWLLILRGIGVEFRLHLEGEVWTGLFDGFFALASALLAIFFGAALGNVIRGVPLDAEHFFFEPLWTNWLPRGDTGILDWYTVFTGVFALVALTLHGSLYVALKTLGDVHERSMSLANKLIFAVAALTVIGVPVTALVRPATLDNYRTYPIAFVLPAAAAASLFWMWRNLRARNEHVAFYSSCAYLVGMLGGAAAALYPTLLPTSNGSANDITIHNAATGSYAMHVGLIWWAVGMALAFGYFVFVYRMFRGKLIAEAGAGH